MGPTSAQALSTATQQQSDFKGCRVGVLLDSAVQERWVLEMVRAAIRAPGAQLVCIAIAPAETPVSVAARLYRLVGGLDERLRCRGDDLLARTAVAAAFPDVLHVEIALRGGRDAWFLDDSDTSALCDVGADVWLCFCAGAPRRPLPRLARHGVWGLEIGVDVSATDHWAGAPEVVAGSPVTITRIVDYSERGGAPIYQGVGATIGNSARRNRLIALRRAMDFFARSIEAIVRDGIRVTSDGRPADYPVKTAPTVSAVAQLAWRLARRVAENRWLALGWRPQWQVAYEFTGDDIDLGQLRYLVPPPDRFWADPFVLDHDGRRFIFFEECAFKTAHGRIVAVEVDEHEAPRAAPQVALERPYHLSYPFVFRWQGEIYMLPETAENGTVELYRCEELPSRWRLERVLLTNVRAYDATLWQQRDRWWMFATIAPAGTDGNDELHLYSAATPLGPWTPHPRNPVVVDTRRARSAGPLFVRGGALYRPSQDCSIAYGHSVSINRVDVLDQHAYVETPLKRIEPGWRSDILRVHTLGGSGTLRVVDALVKRRRWAAAGVGRHT